MGKVDLTDAQPAREHVQHLLEQGMTTVLIADASGVHNIAIRVLLGIHPNRKPSARVRHATAAALLAVQVNRGVPVGKAMVPVAGTYRRIRALQAIGYREVDLCKHLGMSGARMIQFCRGEQVYASTARRVAQMYEQLRDTPGPSGRARAIALSKGYLPPIWWDDDEIDDPQFEPEGLRVYKQGARVVQVSDETAIERAMSGDSVELTREERTEAVERLNVRGHNDTEIGERLGMSNEAVLQVRRRAGNTAAFPVVLLDDYSASRPDRVRLLRSRRMNADEIAERIGVPKRYIVRDIERNARSA